MGGETVTLSNSSDWKKSVGSISILVVDDDATCLSIVSAILKKFKYEVVTVKHPSDALCRLRVKETAFDLVVSDVHMPDMNGFELQKTVSQEFNLPVVLMSADEEEGVALKGLESGAAFFILKPVSPDDFRDLWQFTAMKKKSEVVIEEIEGSSPEEKTSTEKDNNSSERANSASSDMLNKKDTKKKSSKKESSDEKKGENSKSASKKKPKIVWTNSLHNRFLEAIRKIGLDRAVPKKILEVMNVPGLTRENVASHLQKYRIFLRRVSDASFKIQHSDHKGLSNSIPNVESLESTTPSTLMLNRFNNLQYYTNPGQSPIGAPAAPNLPTQASSSSQSGFGQSLLLSNNGSLLKSSIGNTNLVHQNDSLYARLAQNNYQMHTSVEEHLPNISMPDLSTVVSIGFDALFGSPRVNPSTSYEVSPHISIGEISPHLNIGTLSITSSMPSWDFPYPTNYVGYSLSNIKNLTELGQKEKNQGLNYYGSIVNLFGNELEHNRTVQTTTLANDNINLDQLAQHVGASDAFVADNNGGEQLSNIIADYQVLPPLNPSFVSGAENVVEIHEPAFSPMFDLSEFDLLSTQQHLQERDFGATLAGPVNIQNQQNGGDTITSSNSYGGIPSTDQAPNQRDDDDFLESLLAPFGEDPSFDGI